jgi:hypothetical protein
MAKRGRKPKIEPTEEQNHGERQEEEVQENEGLQGDVLNETKPSKSDQDTRMRALREHDNPEPPKSNKVDALQPGQKYFEAPDGTLVIGEESQGQLWHRKMNNGKGGWINPRR